jgi:hypothetical protein
MHGRTNVKKNIVKVFILRNNNTTIYFMFFVPYSVIQLCNVNQQMHTFQT